MPETQLSDQLTAARRLYDAFGDHDAGAILAALHPDFEGEVSAGMPLGVGGRYQGPETMLHDVWAPVFATYDVRVEADELLVAGDRVVAFGAYRGTERATGTPFEAAFAHILTIRNGQIGALCQITDTRSWPVSQRPDGADPSTRGG